MTTPRRAILAAIVAAPVAVASGAAAAQSVAVDFSAMGADDLLEFGSRNADAAFARLCAVALDSSLRYRAAADLADDAEEAALREMPDFPESLTVRSRYTPKRGPDSGKPQVIVERVTFDSELGALCWHVGQRRARSAGIPSAEALAQLRAEYEAYRAASDAVNAHYMVEAFNAAAHDLGPIAAADLRRVNAAPARNAEALTVKLHLQRVVLSEGSEMQSEDFAALVADAGRVLAL